MSEVQPLGFISFDAPDATDVVAVRIYAVDAADPDGLSHASNFNDVNIGDAEDDPNEEGKLRVNMAGLEIVGGPADGSLLVGVAFVDDAGNVGDISEPVTVPFDQEAPEQVTGVSYSQS